MLFTYSQIEVGDKEPFLIGIFLIDKWGLLSYSQPIILKGKQKQTRKKQPFYEYFIYYILNPQVKAKRQGLGNNNIKQKDMCLYFSL